MTNLNYEVETALHALRAQFYTSPLPEEAKRYDEIRPGYFIITGFNPNDKSHYSNIVNGATHPLVGYQLNGDLYETLNENLKHVDGAVLIDYDNILYRIGSRLRNNVEPEDVASALGLEVLDDESRTFGFAHPVNTRHINALYASFLMPGTTVFTMSGKTGDIRKYEKGRITSSTVPEEMPQERSELERLVA